MSSSEDRVDRRKTFDLRLSKQELVHLRDLFSVTLPTEMKQTVSQALANVAERPLVEAKLWQKVAAVCRAASLPMDAEAPDFVAAASASPPVSVFLLQHEPPSEDLDEASVFSGSGVAE